MKLYFQRLNEKGEGVSLAGELFVNTDNKFTFHFDVPAKNIVLADGKAHDLVNIGGTITSWWMDREGMYLRVFHKTDETPGGGWVSDQLTFRFRTRLSSEYG